MNKKEGDQKTEKAAIFLTNDAYEVIFLDFEVTNVFANYLNSSNSNELDVILGFIAIMDQL